MSFCVQLRNKMDAQYISVKQNGRRLLDKEGMEYRLIKKREKKSYWECVNKKMFQLLRNSCGRQCFGNDQEH